MGLGPLFNQQIGERMQERDEDLAAAYLDLDRKDTIIAKKDVTILRLIIWGIGVSLALLLVLVTIVLNWYGKLKLPIKF